MSILSIEHALSPELPAAWTPALVALAEIKQLAAGPAEQLHERQQRARQLYGQLLELAKAYEEPIPEDLDLDVSGAGPQVAGSQTSSVRRWFSEAVLLWMRYAETSSAPLVDTAGTRTLGKFPVDFPVDAAARGRMLSATRQAFAWSTEEFAVIEARVAHLTSNLDLKLRITDCVASFLQQHMAAGGRDGRIVLMDALYGELPWRAGDIDWVITRTSIFPCVPRKKRQLLVADWDARSQAEREVLGEFLTRLSKANTANTLRFPAFGLGPERPTEPLLSRLLEATEVPEQVLLETLQTMVMVVPTHQVDQYVVHDSWGHTWQEALSEFEWEYARVLELADDLTPEAGPAFGGDVPCFADCFRAENGKVSFDGERLLVSARADVLGRLQVACSIALSEMLADFMESKFARSVPEEALPTSSLIDVAHLKIDLSLGDLGRQILRLSTPYSRLATDAELQQRFAQQLADRLQPQQQAVTLAAAVEATRAAGEWLWEQLSPYLDPEILPAGAEADATSSADTKLPSSLYRRALLQMLLIGAELERGLEATGGDWTNPEASPDLFLIAITHLYEQDRARNFWHMDQVMRVVFAPACQRIQAALATDAHG